MAVRQKVLVALLLGVAVEVSVLLDGFDFGVDNNAFQVPLLLRAADPSLFPGDPFVASLDHYSSGLWWLLAKGTWIQDWSGCFFWLHLLTRVAFFAAVYLLLWRLLASRFQVLLSCLALAVAQPLLRFIPVGGAEIFHGVFDHTEVALVLVLFSFACAVRERATASFALMGLAFDVNGFYGLWGLFALSLLFLFWRVSGGVARRVGQLAWRLMLFLAVASPVLIWLIRAQGVGPGFEAFDYRTFLAEFFPGHFLLWSAGGGLLAEMVLMVAAGFAAAQRLGEKGKELHLLLIALVLLFLVGSVLPLVSSHSWLLNLHLLRTTGLMVVLAVLGSLAAFGSQSWQGPGDATVRAEATFALLGVVAGNWMVVALAFGLEWLRRIQGSQRRRLLLLGLMLAASLAMAWLGAPQVPSFRLPGQDAWFSLGWVLGAGVLLLGQRQAQGGLWALLGLSGLAGEPWLASAAWLLLLGFTAVPSRWARQLLLLLGIFVAAAAAMILTVPAVRLGVLAAAGLLAGGLVLSWKPGPEPGSGKRAALAALAVMLLSAVAPAVVWRASAGSLSNLDPEEKSLREVGRWARRATPVDSVFLVNYRTEDFPVHSHRSVWVDWQQGAAAMWERSYYRVWKQRLRDQAEASDVLGFATKNGITHALVDKNDPKELLPSADLAGANLPVLFETDFHRVYDLSGKQAGPEKGSPGAEGTP